jgi:hypothetical protein
MKLNRFFYSDVAAASQSSSKQFRILDAEPFLFLMIRARGRVKRLINLYIAKKWLIFTIIGNIVIYHQTSTK